MGRLRGFTDNFRSPVIRKVLERLQVDVVEVFGDNLAKVRLPKTQYESFVGHLEKNATYVQSIRESTLQEKLASPFSTR